MYKYFSLAFLVFITILGGLLRLIYLSDLPSELHRDELAIGYNAFSILKTGFDEYGNGPYPILFRSVGDYKLPGLVYASVLAIRFLDFTVLSFRLPTALLATMLIPIAFLFAKELAISKRFPYIVSFLLSISIWHVFLSRTAYEPIAGLTISTAALTLFLIGRRKSSALVASILVFLVSFLTYNVPLLLSPLLVLLLSALYKNEYIDKSRRTFIFAVMLFFVVVAGYLVVFSSITSGKSEATIFSKNSHFQRNETIEIALFKGGVTYRIRQIIGSEYLDYLQLFLQNYLSAFNPSYLFFHGGSNYWHNLAPIGFGNINVALLPAILFGIWIACKRKNFHHAGFIFILVYFLVSPIPDALTLDAPVTNRLLDFHFSLLLLASIGIDGAYSAFRKNKLFLILFSTYALMVIGVFIIFLFRYFFSHTYTLDPSWLEGSRNAARSAVAVAPFVDRVYIDVSFKPGLPEYSVPYLLFAFTSKYEPILLQNSVRSTEKGYDQVTDFHPFYVREIPKIADMHADTLATLFPDTTRSVAILTQGDRITELEPYAQIYNKKNEIAWTIFIINKDELGRIVLGN